MMPMTARVSSSGARSTAASGNRNSAEAQEAVGAELEQDAGQDHRAGGRRLGVGVGQPGVEREQRHLDREGDGEAEEEPARWSAGQRALAVGPGR